MIELESRDSAEAGKEMPDSQGFSAGRPAGTKRNALLIAILSTALLCSFLVWGTAVVWGSSPVLTSAPWYIPLIGSFTSLIAILIGYLALGRYQVLRDPVSFWVGTGYLVYGIGQIFYVLTWPGLLPNGDPIIGHLASTSAWIALMDLTLLQAFLLAAVLNPWPNRFSLPGSQWRKRVLTFLLVATIFFSFSILLESSLPVLVDGNGLFTYLQKVWLGVLLCFFVLGSVYSVLYYQRSHDRLVGFITFPQMGVVFICMMVLLGGKRYDLWWYVQRVVLVGGHLAVLYGLLSEYIQLLKQESDGRRMLEAILENIPVGLAVTGGPPDFSIARISRHGLEMNGRESEARVGSATLVDPERLKIILSSQDSETSSLENMPLYRASHFGEEIRNMELVMEAQNGKKIPVLVNAAPIHDIQGNIVAAISTWLDITDRKLAEQRLQASEALYRAIARSIPRGGIFVVDRNLRYVIAEGIIAEKFGVSKEMIEGHTIPEIFDREVAAKMEARFHRAFEGETISYETEYNGRIYWTQHAVMDDPAGHAIVITMDVTERKQAEKALGESEQRFRAIINQATAGIIRTDIQGSALFVNQAFCDMLGCSEDDLVDERIWKYTHPDDIEESRRLFDRLREKGKPFYLEERLIRNDGSTLWVNVSAAPILDEVDKPQSAVFIVVDITERKNAEEALQKLNLELESRVETRTAELQAANWALFESRRRLQILSQRLVDVQEEERRAIARELHDRVGQTLTALNLNLTIVSDQLGSQGTGHMTERLADSIKLVTEMISIVRDVMSDLRPIVLDEYGLDAALRAYLAKFEARYGIHVHFDRANQSQIIPHLGAGLEMTVLRIAQEALLNIARHAQADHVTLALQCDEETLLLSIEDNGVGIQSWHAPANGRSGHGLMLMRERAEAVGGTLKISSIPAKGTRIEAYLPYENSGENKMEKEGRS
jgi:PAS domain S-box-containing protein